MQCNIDARGKRVRLIGGILTLLIAVIVAGVALFAQFTAWWAWLVIALLVISGGFTIFEARTSWCALRALGVKTPV